VRNDVAWLTGLAIGVGTIFLLDAARRRSSVGNRIRAELARVVSHPRAIEVSVLHEGCVSLSGPILSSEADAALAAVAGMRGVATVEDNLERHDSAEGVPALQGGYLRTA
jgi:osmotically-inducible protein OsmY